MMKKVFSKKCLKKIRDSLSKKMEPIDNQDADVSILLSVRHRANNEMEKAVEALNGVKDKKLRRLFQQIPNTNSRIQTQQGVKPDRPDFKVVIGKKEMAFGEVTDPSQRNDRKKNGWDLYRLSRFGTAVLNQGTEVMPLVQVLAGSGTIYRHFVKGRGIVVLAEVGVFSVPTTTIHMGAAGISSNFVLVPNLAQLKNIDFPRNAFGFQQQADDKVKEEVLNQSLSDIRRVYEASGTPSNLKGILRIHIELPDVRKGMPATHTRRNPVTGVEDVMVYINLSNMDDFFFEGISENKDDMF
ncbi:hypothetical protein KI688_004936 [Linnemannia hyalina]|uniref:Uncharacterized protein n=1 Tax=Linnemannia hyalina TaxID=64524 RepID=A0A9P7XL93_9FUNG|nr:hypothetical protein KI688_004936 [Linnemannia hyalina]